MATSFWSQATCSKVLRAVVQTLQQQRLNFCSWQMRKYDSPQAGSKVSGWDGTWPFLSQLPRTLPPLPAWSVPQMPCCNCELTFCAELPRSPHPKPWCKKEGGRVQAGLHPGWWATVFKLHLGWLQNRYVPWKEGTLWWSKHMSRTCLERIAVLLRPLNCRAQGTASKANLLCCSFVHGRTFMFVLFSGRQNKLALRMSGQLLPVILLFYK